VLVTDLDKDLQEETGIKEGAYIVEVVENSEAENIGLKEGDIITSFNGKTIKNADDLHNQIEDIDEEMQVKLTVKRNNEDKNFKATLRKSEGDNTFEVHVDDEEFSFDMEDLPEMENFHSFFDHGKRKGGYLGVHARNISESMLNYFEVDYGVLVEEIIKDSPAEEAGLQAGDVIMKINDRDIKDYRDLVRTLNFYNPGEKVTVHFSRKGSSKKASVTLAEHEEISMRKKWFFKNGDKRMRWIDRDKKIRDRNDIRVLPGEDFKLKLPRQRFLVI